MAKKEENVIEDILSGGLEFEGGGIKIKLAPGRTDKVGNGDVIAVLKKYYRWFKEMANEVKALKQQVKQLGGEPAATPKLTEYERQLICGDCGQTSPYALDGDKCPNCKSTKIKWTRVGSGDKK